LATGSATLRGLTLPCLDFETTRHFYVELLGLSVKSQGKQHLLLDGGGPRIVLMDAARVPGFTRSEGQGIYMELAVPDLLELEARLTTHNHRVFRPRADSDGRLITVQDPEGNLINLVAAEG
jgi:predicted enzyme related to lactoylglutathione lyase